MNPCKDCAWTEISRRELEFMDFAVALMCRFVPDSKVTYYEAHKFINDYVNQRFGDSEELQPPCDGSLTSKA